MATTLGGGFKFTAKELADDRFFVTSSSDRFTFQQARMGDGLTTFASDTSQYFILVNSESYTTNTGWRGIPLSNSDSTSSFTITNITSSVISASNFYGGSGSFPYIDIADWGDLSASLAAIEEAAGAQNLASVTALGNNTNGPSITASGFIASGTVGGFVSIQNVTPFPNEGTLGGSLIWENDESRYGDIAAIEARHTSNFTTTGNTNFTGSAALVFTIAPYGVQNRQNGIPNASATNIPVLVLSGSSVEGQAIFPNLTTESVSPGQDADFKAVSKGVSISGGSGSRAGYISPFSESRTMNFGSESKGYTLDFNENIARFNDSYISGSTLGVPQLRFHSDIFEFKKGTGNTVVRVKGNLSGSSGEFGNITGSSANIINITSSRHVTTNMTASSVIKLGGGASTDPGITKGTGDFLRAIGKGIDLDTQTTTPTAVAGAIMFSASNGEGAFYLGVTF